MPSIVPDAILQPPFFDLEADYVCNYGAIGAVIGHEMTHGFDDQGCQFDKDGNLANWWTAGDKARYDERTKVIADWFSEQEAVPGLKVNGQKTLGLISVSTWLMPASGLATQRLSTPPCW